MQACQLSRIWVNETPYEVCGPEHIVTCRTCGMVYVNPRIVSHPAISAYSTEQELHYFRATREGRERAYVSLLSRLPRWCQRPPVPIQSLLDIGCGDGVLLELARQYGWQSAGTEIREPLVRMVRESYGYDAIVGSDLHTLPASSYDVVALINVLEHVPEPRVMLRDIARLLRPGGVVLLHVPNLGGLPARLKGPRWHQIEPLGHLCYFTEKTLGAMLHSAGLHPVGRFSLVMAGGIKGMAQLLLDAAGIYLDNGLGIVARQE